MVTIEIMNEGGEDRISNLPDGVVTHILSRLPTKDAMRTSVLSKDWKHRWTSIYNIQLDDRSKLLRGKERNNSFASFMERVLNATQDSRITSFRLECATKSDPEFLKTCVTRVLKRGVEKLEIKTHGSGDNTFVEELYNYKSLTELKLQSDCILSTSLMKNCFLNLKILHLGNWVCLAGDEVSNTSDVLLNFPVLEELELRYCRWKGVKYVEINAPALISFVVEGYTVVSSYDYLIKIYGPKLQKFESCGYLLDNYHVVAPSIYKAILTNSFQQGTSLGFRAHALLKGFSSTLQYLKLSNAIVKALIGSSLDFSLLRFNNLKQLELKYFYADEELLTKLLRVMPSLESFSLSMCFYNEGLHPHFYYDGLHPFPSGVASCLKVVELVEFVGTTNQIQFAESVLKNADNLDTLFVYVGCKPLMPKNQIKHLLSSCPISSTRATVVVNGLRNRRRN